MKRFPWIPIAILLAPLATLAQAPLNNPSTNTTPPASHGKSDWSRVLALAHGDEITVTLAKTGSLRCYFTGATQTELYCERRAPSIVPFAGGQEYTFHRSDVVKVQRRHFSRNFKATVVASAAVGCALGWGGGGPIGCFAGGFGLAAVGGVIGIMAWYWLPGKVIYEDRAAAHLPEARPQSSLESPALERGSSGAGAE